LYDFPSGLALFRIVRRKKPMRLTLRTLLAYLDNILDEKDAVELRQKIEDSDFAKGLVQRIQSASARTRLGAPSVTGKGMGMDPNTVAEYLDNALPPDRVPDLERICLESDVHLAEVASCHQILAIVLGETAHVDPGLRERIYRIGAPDTDRTEAEHGQQAVVDSGQMVPDGTLGTADPALDDVYQPPLAPAPPPTTVTSAGRRRIPGIHREKMQVPDYLRAGQRSNWKPLVITLCLAFLLSAVALRAMGPFDRSHPLLRFAGGGASPVVEGDSSARSTAVDQTPALVPAEDPAEDPSEGSRPGEQTDGPAVADQAVDPSDDDQIDTDVTRDQRPSDEDRPPIEVQGPDSQEPMDDGARETPDFPVTTPNPTDVVDDVAAEAYPAAKPDLAETSPVAPQEVAGEPVEVGFVRMKDQHFPVRFDISTQKWYRLPARSKLFSGDRLRILPTFQPEVVLAPGVQATFAGASSVYLTPPTSEGDATLTMDYGRVLFATAGVPGARLHLTLGDRTCVVTFLEAASEIAVETRSFLPLGANPEVDPTQRVIRVFSVIGRIEWQDGPQEERIPVAEDQVRVLVDTRAETISAGELPSWILGDDLREIDRSASAVLANFLVADRPISLSLRERTQDRRTEIRALAAVSLSQLDSHEALVAELDDQRQRAHWSSSFEALRLAIARSPESAAAVRQEFERLFPKVAAQAYRLLLGFSQQQLVEGADETSVGLLEHPSLCVRVLAFENLRRITGMTLLYRPEASEELRRSRMRGWRDRLDNRTILFDIPPTATSEEW
jgi:hypothetical protein